MRKTGKIAFSGDLYSADGCSLGKLRYLGAFVPPDSFGVISRADINNNSPTN